MLETKIQLFPYVTKATSKKFLELRDFHPQCLFSTLASSSEYNRVFRHSWSKFITLRLVENIGFEPMSLACKASAKTNSANSPLKIVYDVHIFHHKKKRPVKL